MEIIEKIKRHLAPMSWAEMQRFAERAGVPFHTLRKIQSGETKNPKAETCQAILNAMKGRRK